MKRLIIILMISSAFTACEKDDDSSTTYTNSDGSTTSGTSTTGSTTGSTTYSTTGSTTSSTGSTTAGSNTTMEGRWTVNSFSENGNIETDHFKNYQFAFESNGTVNALINGMSVPGTWAWGNGNHTQLLIQFGSTPLNELNEDWYVLEFSANQVRLQHVSGGNGGTDLLTFKRLLNI